MATELTRRVAVAGVGIPIAIVIIYLGGWALAALIALIAALGAGELFNLAEKKQVQPMRSGGALAAAAIVLIAGRFEPGIAADWLWGTAIALLILFAGAAIWRRGVEGHPLASAALTAFGALFVGGTLSYALWLRALTATGGTVDWSDAWRGTAVLAFPLAVTWINDTFAYFGGRAFGRHKLIPKVSPGKTIEGSIAGAIGGVLVALLYGAPVLGERLGFGGTLLHWGMAGLGIAALAQIGDLAESLFKREAGVKDSGTLLPGHGGVLDRFDALFFTLPAAYAFLLLVQRIG